MIRDKLSLPVLVSFNELIWIFVFAVAVLYAIQTTRLREITRRVDEGTKKEIALKQELEQAHHEAINQQLVGLNGSLHRVVIAIDHSGSMAYRGKWKETRRIVETWLQYLPIEECSLVIFNDSVEVYPADGTFLSLRSPDSEGNRGKLMDRLRAVEPYGTTNTLKALREAYSHIGVTMIVLFTDGFPDTGSNRFNRRMAAATYAICRQYGRTVPVNIVGLGRYSKRRPIEFLLGLSRVTGGTFFGR